MWNPMRRHRHGPSLEATEARTVAEVHLLMAQLHEQDMAHLAERAREQRIRNHFGERITKAMGGL
jgi:hypothetical protein